MKAELEAGHPIVINVGPGDFTDTGHFMEMCIRDRYKDGRITGQELDNWTKNVLQNFVSLHKNIEENYEVDICLLYTSRCV